MFFEDKSYKNSETRYKNECYIRNELVHNKSFCVYDICVIFWKRSANAHVLSMNREREKNITHNKKTHGDRLTPTK